MNRQLSCFALLQRHGNEAGVAESWFRPPAHRLARVDAARRPRRVIAVVDIVSERYTGLGQGESLLCMDAGFHGLSHSIVLLGGARHGRKGPVLGQPPQVTQVTAMELQMVVSPRVFVRFPWAVLQARLAARGCYDLSN